MLAGLGLLLMEIVTPGGFYFLFLGVAAFAVGLIAAVGVGPDWLLLLIFSLLATGMLAWFRGPLLRRLKASDKSGHLVDNLAGETVVLSTDVTGHGTGQGELRGTVWSVRNASEQAMSKGQHCRVERVDGLTLIVRPD